MKTMTAHDVITSLERPYIGRISVAYRKSNGETEWSFPFKHIPFSGLGEFLTNPPVWARVIVISPDHGDVIRYWIVPGGFIPSTNGNFFNV